MKEIIFTYIFSYLIVVISCIIYTLLGLQNLDYFIDYYCSFFITIFYIVVSYYLYAKCNRKEKKLKRKYYFIFAYFGISLATLLNMIIFKFFPVKSNLSNVSDLFLLFSSGIVGPILEEILFRYIFYYRLRENHSMFFSIFVSSFFFAIFHFAIIKIIYAFILGIFLAFIYEEEKKIFAPILIHIGANIFSFFLNIFDWSVFILAIINFLIASYLIFRQTKIS